MQGPGQVPHQTMTESRRDAAEGISIGVLIIGSLYWDSSEHRKRWRRECLELDAKKYVRVPIRYGRLSAKRGCSYTMVFSMSLVHEERLGRAIIVPYKQRVRVVADLVEQARQLWTAERDSGKPNGRISAKDGYWGCVGLLINPDSPIPDCWLPGWRQHVSGEQDCYEALKTANDEQPVVDGSGLLQIPWPRSEDGSALEVDLLLATATNPTIVGGHYPSPCEVADAWNTLHGKKHVEYFDKNIRYGIKTFQDHIIEDRLRELRQ